MHFRRWDSVSEDEQTCARLRFLFTNGATLFAFLCFGLFANPVNAEVEIVQSESRTLCMTSVGGERSLFLRGLQDGAVELWDASSAERVSSLRLRHSVVAIDFHADSGVWAAAVTSGDGLGVSCGTLNQEGDELKHVWSHPVANAPFNSCNLSISPDGKKVVGGLRYRDEMRCAVFDCRTGAGLWQSHKAKDPGLSNVDRRAHKQTFVDFVSNEGLVLLDSPSGNNGRLRVVDLAEGRRHRFLTTNGSIEDMIVTHPDGFVIALSRDSASYRGVTRNVMHFWRANGLAPVAVREQMARGFYKHMSATESGRMLFAEYSLPPARIAGRHPIQLRGVAYGPPLGPYNDYRWEFPDVGGDGCGSFSLDATGSIVGIINQHRHRIMVTHLASGDNEYFAFPDQGRFGEGLPYSFTSTFVSGAEDVFFVASAGSPHSLAGEPSRKDERETNLIIARLSGPSVRDYGQ